jgi:hypothetical protein
VFSSTLFDCYHFTFGSEVKYTRPLLIRSALDWKYRGVLHEFLFQPNP